MYNKPEKLINYPAANLLAYFSRYVSTKAPSLELSGFYKQKQF